VTAAPGRRLLLLLVLLPAVWPSLAHGDALRVTFDPARPRAGDVVLARIHGAPPAAVVELMVDGHPFSAFATAGGHAAVVGLDMDAPAGARRWQAVARTFRGVTSVAGAFPLTAREYKVQRLTVAPSMVELDPVTEKRATDETERMRLTYRRISGERLWRGRWLRPVAGDEPGTGFGSRRVINGQPRAPHSGIDFAAPVGTPIVAANRGRVVLLGEFFFPGRLVILDHGLGLHTAYFHLDSVAVKEGQLVARGERLGTVGMTGRITGPHLHFGAQVGSARIDPAALLGLAPNDERD
jgi:murein DD-endopeptidase MepM/ murein hydrolase activator NlpD